MQSQQICAAAPTGGIHALVAYNRETMSRNPISDQNAPRLPALFNAIVESYQLVVIDLKGFFKKSIGISRVFFNKIRNRVNRPLDLAFTL